MNRLKDSIMLGLSFNLLVVFISNMGAALHLTLSVASVVGCCPRSCAPSASGAFQVIRVRVRIDSPAVV